jgi:protein gp37
MSAQSSIQWTDHTINFWWGCTKVSPACTHCYAESMSLRRSKNFWGRTIQWGDDHERGDRSEKAAKELRALDTRAMRKGTVEKVFINSMSDWLDARVPIEWLYRLLNAAFNSPHLILQLLTKRPENWPQRIEAVLKYIESLPEWENASASHPLTRLRNFLADWFVLRKPPANLWIGTTVENQHYADERLPHLLRIPATVRFLSCEPLLGPVNIFHDGGTLDRLDAEGALDDIPFDRSNPFRIHQIITGGEQGGKSRPMHLDWVRSLRDQAEFAGICFFFKQWGDYLPVGQQTPEPLAKDTYKGHAWPDGSKSLRVTTPIAGALLDGQAWQQFPDTAEKVMRPITNAAYPADPYDRTFPIPR